LKSQRGVSKEQTNGTISVVQYAGNNLIVPVCSALLQAGLTGTTCVLTKTNEEAALLAGMLRQNGLSAKLIQSNDGFPLHNLYELRYFSQLVLVDDGSPAINLDDWKEAGRKLVLHARQSDKLELALAAVRAFESVTPKRIYKSDWRAFMAESKLEDFIRIGTDTVYVSTIHKAKGKEFDNVYILLNQLRPDRDELKRLLYVAITRAKNDLEIHYNESFLRGLKVPGMSYRQDNEAYPEPAHLVIALTHRDVNLGFFEYVQPRMYGLLSGSPLTIVDDGLGNAHGQALVKFSAGFKSILDGYKAKGYQLSSAFVNFIVYWKKQGSEKEIKIVLPQIGLDKAGA
jgi:ATP-dependent DNA helicase RecQ